MSSSAFWCFPVVRLCFLVSLCRVAYHVRAKRKAHIFHCIHFLPRSFWSPAILPSVLLQEFLIKGLANSKTFQRFAVRTDRHLSEYKQKGEQRMNETLDDLHKSATEAMHQAQHQSSGYHTAARGSTGPPTLPARGFAGFAAAFGPGCCVCFCRVLPRLLG